VAGEPNGGGLPEPTEQVHMPEPSYLPVVTGFGITLMLVGVILNWVITIIGAVMFIPAVLIWIRDTRADIAELPLEHE
jgi:hypothetical protein